MRIFGSIVTEAISSKLSSANRLSAISVVGASQFLIEEERRLSGLRRTEADGDRNSRHSETSEFSKRIQGDQFKDRMYNQSTRAEANRAPFGCEMMSCTSSGLFWMTSAASLKVTPSRLMLFREIRRPPADKGHSGTLLASKKQMSDGLRCTSELMTLKSFKTPANVSYSVTQNETSDSKMTESSGLRTWTEAAVPVSGSIRHD